MTLAVVFALVGIGVLQVDRKLVKVAMLLFFAAMVVACIDQIGV